MENLQPDGNCLYRGIAASLNPEQYLGDHVSPNLAIPKEDYYQKVKDLIFKKYMINNENRDGIINLLNIRNQNVNLVEVITEERLSVISNELAKKNVFADYMDILTVIISQVFKCNITIWTIDMEFNLCPSYIVNYSDIDTNTVDINLLYVCIEEESTTGRGKYKVTFKETLGHYLLMSKKNE